MVTTTSQSTKYSPLLYGTNCLLIICFNSKYKCARSWNSPPSYTVYTVY